MIDPNSIGNYDVTLHDFGPTKIGVIVAIRQITGCGIRRAVELTNEEDSKILRAVSRGTARDAKALLKTAGGIVTITRTDP